MPAFDQGTQANRYQLIPRTLIFVTCGEYVLMVRGAENKKLWANLYNGLGGHVERGESILGSARRELLEESGLSVQDLRLVGVITVDTGDSPGIGIYVLRGNLPMEKGNGLPMTTPNVEGALEWIPYQNLQNLPLVEDLFRLLPVVLSVQPQDAPFSARYAYAEEGHLMIEFDSVEN